MKIAVALLLSFSIAASAQSVLGRRAPGFSLPDTRFQQHDIQDYRGKVVLIDIMRTDCPHCQQLTLALHQVKAKYGDKVQILSVVNPPDNQASVQKYITAHKVTNPVLFDCGQMAASYLQVTPKNPSVSVPHLIIVDKTGMIRKDLSENSGGGLGLQNLLSSIDPYVN